MIQIIAAKADREALDESAMGTEFESRLPGVDVEISEIEFTGDGEAPADLVTVTLIALVASSVANGKRIFLVVEGSMPGISERIAEAAHGYAYCVVVGLHGSPQGPINGDPLVISQGGPAGLRLAAATTCELAKEAGLVS